MLVGIVGSGAGWGPVSEDSTSETNPPLKIPRVVLCVYKRKCNNSRRFAPTFIKSHPPCSFFRRLVDSGTLKMLPLHGNHVIAVLICRSQVGGIGNICAVNHTRANMYVWTKWIHLLRLSSL